MKFGEVVAAPPEPRYRNYVLGGAGRRLYPQFHRSPDHQRPRARPEARPGAQRCRSWLSLRHRLRGILCAVRYPDGAARRQLEPDSADDDRSCAVVGDDDGVGLCAQRAAADARAHRRRHRRSDGQPLRLFDPVGLFSARQTRDRTRHLFGRHVCRRRAVAVPRRRSAAALECGLSRWLAWHRRVAGHLHDRRDARSAARAGRRDAERAGARAFGRACHAARRAPVSRLRRGTGDDVAADRR